ncbi:MAG TPA: hypothetical protein VJU16_07000 [Planctomycetota bacterium]|nr:hypothetical protein [Planctomycetota bacterium]
MGRQKYEGAKSQGAVRLSANPADGNTVTITPVSGTAKVYEFDSGGGVGAGNVAVTIGGTAALTIAALVAAINANKPTPAVVAYVDPIDTSTCRIEGEFAGSAGNHGLAVVGGNLSTTGANLTGGENAENQVEARGEYIVTALDVTAQNIMISTGLGSPRMFQLECRSSTGLLKSLTSLCTIDGSRIKVDTDGATNPAAGDKLVWSAWE